MELTKGIRIATAAMAMLAGMVGCSGDDDDKKDGTPTTQGIICQGGNTCKGMGECKAADGKNACQGMGSCAGMGFVTATDQADCDAKKAAAKTAAAAMAPKI